MIDLSEALRSAAHTGTATRPPIAAAPVLGRIRRRRTVRRATDGVAGATAVGALALGGWQLAGIRAQQAPPAIGTSTEPRGPFALSCGDAVPVREGAPDEEGAAGLELMSTLRPSGPGSLLYAELALVGVPAEAGGSQLSIEHGPQLLVAQDGVIVALTDEAAVPDAFSGGGSDAGDGGDAVQRVDGLEQTIQLVSCADPGVPLAEGDYDLFGVQAFEHGPVDGAVTSTAVASGPWPFTISSGSDTEPTAAPGPTAEPLPTPEQTEAAPLDEADDSRPSLDELVISMSGLGPVTLGMNLSGAAEAGERPADGVLEWVPDYCVGTDAPGRWMPSYPDDDPIGGPVEGEPDVPFDFAPSVFEDVVVRIDVLAAGPQTAEGIGVGSTLAELRAALPDATLLPEPLYSLSGAELDAWVLQDGERTLGFEVVRDEDGSSDTDPVVAVAILQGMPYQWPAYGGESCG